MTHNALIKKIHLTDADFDSIKQAVAAAEAKTTGEIALAVTPESAHYSFWELLASNLFAGIVLLILLPFSAQIQTFFNNLYWQNLPAWVLPLFYFIVFFASITVFFYLSNIPFIDKMIIPRPVQTSCVNHRALRYFAESGVYETAEHSGILIFVSYMEHQVRIIADSGISAKISQDMWDLIADELCENLKTGNTTLAFTSAIEKCGELLAQNFPPHAQNPNELTDGLEILEDSEWY